MFIGYESSVASRAGRGWWLLTARCVVAPGVIAGATTGRYLLGQTAGQWVSAAGVFSVIRYRSVAARPQGLCR